MDTNTVIVIALLGAGFLYWQNEQAKAKALAAKPKPKPAAKPGALQTVGAGLDNLRSGIGTLLGEDTIWG